MAGLLVLGLAVGCRAQVVASPPLSAAEQQRVDVAVRNQYSLPADVAISIGARSPSKFAGYDTLPVTLTHNAKSQVVDFLFSTDGQKLVQMNTIDLSKDPADSVPIAGRPIRGNPDAKVTVVNFDDLECPFCARMHEELFPSTLDHYKGLVRIVYKDDPLTELHPWAMHAAVDANCLAEQSGTVYWAYVDYLHSHGEEVSAAGAATQPQIPHDSNGPLAGASRNLQKSFDALDRIARQEATLGKLDEPRLNACIAKDDETQINASLKLADDLGLDGTPAVIVNGEKVNGGAVPREDLWTVIDRALRAQGEQPPPIPPPPAPVPAAKPSAAPATPSGNSGAGN
jgi:protein-disulfide isomerase